MHISEGVLSTPLVAAGWGLTAAGTWLGLRKIEPQRVPALGLMAAMLFVSSLVHVPIGLSNAHLVMNGLAGLLLGWSLFPAMLTALALQALLFQFGGLTSLGVNTFNLAMPGVLVGLLLGGEIAGRVEPKAFRASVLTGSVLAYLSLCIWAVWLCVTRLITGAELGDVELRPALLVGGIAALCGAAAGPLSKDHTRHLAGFTAGAAAVLLSGILAAGSLYLTNQEFVVPALLIAVAHSPVMIVEGVICAIAVGFVHRVKPTLFINNV